jgi:hypothetical protein
MDRRELIRQAERCMDVSRAIDVPDWKEALAAIAREILAEAEVDAAELPPQGPQGARVSTGR